MAADAPELVTELVGHVGVQPADAIPDDPGAMAVGGPDRSGGFAPGEGLDRGAVHDGHRAEGPGKRLLDVGLAVPDELLDQGESATRHLGAPSGPAVDVR